MTGYSTATLITCGILACLRVTQLSLNRHDDILISSIDEDFWSSWHTAAANSFSTIDVDKIPIANCAQDVFLPLHRVSERDDDDNDYCRGMLIRDDIIITSKECSNYNHTFSFPGLGILDATPHTSLNSHQLSNSRLGFLETTAPHHYYSIYQPFRRTRMFLGRSGQYNRDTIIECDEEDRPIAHNFPITNQDLIPLHELEGILPNDILWDDDIMKTTMSSKQTNNNTLSRWWQHAVSIEEEEDTFEQLLKQYKGPTGSLSISHICEVIDPRGHRSNCCQKYQNMWKNEVPFSGQHFFEWLDYGAGRQALHQKQRIRNNNKCSSTSCQISCFDERTHHHMNEEEVQQHEIYITPSQDGQDLIARYKYNDELVSESGNRPHTYVWDINKVFYVAPNNIKHLSLLSGQPVLSGGTLTIGKNGRLWGINYSSGHYKPDIRAAAMMYQDFKDKGYNTSALYWIGWAGREQAGKEPWSTDNCRDTDWESIEISGFNLDVLNQSCHELTVSSTWILKNGDWAPMLSDI